MYNLNNTSPRGNHANIESSFIFQMPLGTCEIEYFYKNINNKFNLNNQNNIYLKNKTWKSMYNFSQKSILVVVSDCKYNKNEYIKNYKEFERINNA